jgi:peptide/nickel transport system substrate-binding protein
MDQNQERLDDVRRGRSEIENHLIDELRAGRISRREFIRRGTVVGMSIPLVAFVAAACGKSSPTAPTSVASGPSGSPSTSAVKPGGTITVSEISPAGAVNPLTVADEGGLATLGQAGQYLTWSNKDLHLEPVIAESWSSNADASVWTFKIRQGVTYNDGTTPLTAADVVATLKAHSDPANKGNALSAFTGVLIPDGVAAQGTDTVVCTLVAPNGSFPYLVSSDNYNVIILPASYDYSGDYTKSLIGSGPWKMQDFNSQTGVTYVKSPKYWEAGLPYLDGFSLKYYADQPSQVLGLQGNSIDVISQFSAATGQALLNDTSLTIYALKSTAHRQVHMRTDQAPFDKPEIRQALALALGRPDLVAGLMNGKADLGNDSPFAPAFPETDTSVPQRALDLTKAMQLMTTAGVPNGFSVTLYTWNGFEIPQLAQLIQQAAAQIKITVKLQVDDAGTYYSKYWLNSPFGITDYGHRGVPNVFLSAPLLSDGTWNAAHYKNPAYDALVKAYVAAVDLTAEKAVANQIETTLLNDTPVAFPYFYNHMSAAKPTVVGAEFTGMGHIRLTKAGLKA